MTLKFAPPKEEAKSFPRYASYTSGEMKTHGGIGFAKNSLQNRLWTYVDNPDYDASLPTYSYSNRSQIRVTRHGFILENVEGDWYVLYEVQPGLKSTEDLPWYKEFYHDRWARNIPYTDFYRNSSYYQGILEKGEAKIIKKAVPMTTDEYVAWRVAVERERLGITE